MINAVYFSLGSNIGRRKDNLKKALSMLLECGIAVKKVSSIYETEPVSKVKQKDFLNICIEAETEFQPERVLKICKTIEKQLGRKPQPSFKEGYWLPRIIDIDIILFGQKIIKKRNLTVPHKHMHERRFVLEPLCEIAPWAYNPRLHKTSRELLNECDDKNKVVKGKKY